MQMSLVIFWLMVLIFCLIIEASTMGLTTIWFAGGALISLFLALADLQMNVQIVVFLAVSFLLLFLTRPLAVKYFNKEREKTNLDSMIGKKAVVISEINALKGSGQVSVGGMEWTAAAYSDELIASGDVVVIREIKGVKLIVEREREEDL